MSERFSTEAVALAQLRTYAWKHPTMGVSEAINALDNAGVFKPVDLQTDYAQPEEILEQAARERHPAGRDVQGYLDRYSTGPESIKPPPTPDQVRAFFGGDAEVTEMQDEVIVKLPAPGFSDTHPRAAQELGDLIRGRDDTEDGRF